ncbi:acetyl-CoA C-acetyltransferase [Vallitalea okinawensis]|uniref:acetyl-CoA C-acetyltransferase n=1 Tax=Vallitalea okinawensis TaxID=2078660 RepID=UPI000CFC89C6|nr:acetyl-CoA C-acetyltransferase [Vallitalea okinawensis]
MSRVYIVAAQRTAIGSFLGTIKDIHPADLGATVLKDIIQKTTIHPASIDEVIIGNVLPAEQGQGIARQVAIKAGIPVEVPAYTLNMVCGSGMKAIMNGYTSIKANMHHLVVAGGVESMSRTPFILPSHARRGHKLGDMVAKDHLVYDALTDAFEGYHMGITAENIAEKYSISREEQDAFALESQRRAIQAVDNGTFKDEIVPVEVKMRREVIQFDVDEYPNRKTNEEKLAKLRPAFKKDGTVTAGNASGLNDGASVVLLASEHAVEIHGLTPLAEVIGIGQGGVEPSIMGMGPVPAIGKVLSSIDKKLIDMELIELNEAFAAQSLGVIRELSDEHQVSQEWIKERTNVNGGAIALGHPVGISGNRIVVTLIHEMKKRGLTYGLASLCIGGGMGTALILKI